MILLADNWVKEKRALKNFRLSALFGGYYQRKKTVINSSKQYTHSSIVWATNWYSISLDRVVSSKVYSAKFMWFMNKYVVQKYKGLYREIKSISDTSQIQIRNM